MYEVAYVGVYVLRQRLNISALNSMKVSWMWEAWDFHRRMVSNGGWGRLASVANILTVDTLNVCNDGRCIEMIYSILHDKIKPQCYAI